MAIAMHITYSAYTVYQSANGTLDERKTDIMGMGFEGKIAVAVRRKVARNVSADR